MSADTGRTVHPLMPNILRHGIPQHIADQVIADVEDSLWLAAHDAEVEARALDEAATAAVTEDEGIPWDNDYDRATVSAWLSERADNKRAGAQES